MITQNMYKCYHFSLSAIVIIFMLSFSLVHIFCYHLCYLLGCYHLCYHLMLSFFTVSKCYHFFIFPGTYFVSSFLFCWCGGRTHLLGGEGGGGSIFWKTSDTALYSTYVSICGIEDVIIFRGARSIIFL
jgi:hypothetical protein